MKHFPTLLGGALALTAAASLTAQSDFYSPPWTGFNWETSSSGAAPADDAGRTQFIHAGVVPAGRMITSVGWRRTPGSTDVGGFVLDAEIGLASTADSPQTIVSSFATNIANATNYTVIFPRGPLNVPVMPANSSPAEFFQVPLLTPYSFAGPNVLVDVETFGTISGSENWSLDRCLDSTSSGAVNDYGASCSSATIDIDEINSTDNYLPGTSIALELLGAAPSAPAAAVAGFNAATYNGLPLPVDLTTIGMPGCFLLTSVEAVLPSGTDAMGDTVLNVPIPNAVLDNVVVNFQWAYVDTALTSPLQLATTNAYMLEIGPRSCPGVGYNYSFTAGATTGIVTDDNGPIMKFTTMP